MSAARRDPEYPKEQVEAFMDALTERVCELCCLAEMDMDEAVPWAITELRHAIGGEAPEIVEEAVQRFEAESKAVCEEYSADEDRGSDHKKDKVQQGQSQNRPPQFGGNPRVATVPTVVGAKHEGAEEAECEAGATTHCAATECLEECEEPKVDKELANCVTVDEGDDQRWAQASLVRSHGLASQRSARVQGAQQLSQHICQGGTDDPEQEQGLSDAGEPPAESPSSAAVQGHLVEDTGNANAVDWTLWMYHIPNSGVEYFFTVAGEFVQAAQSAAQRRRASGQAMSTRTRTRTKEGARW